MKFLNTDLQKALKSPEVKDGFKRLGEGIVKFATEALPKIIKFITFVGRNIDFITKFVVATLALGTAMKIVGSIVNIAGKTITAVGYAIKAVGFAVKALGMVFNKATAKVAWSATKMIGHAVAVGVAWTANAIKVSAQWTVELAKTVAKSAWAVTKMIPHAADVGLAWVINAVRVSFVWVTQELPKIVAGMAKTSFWAVVHAAKSSAAWVYHAAISATAWAVTQLPRIIASFAVTSAQAVVHALITSTAWTGSAVKTATVWVVTQLPRIIAAFAVTSASAVAHAAIASAAWVGAAVKSTASFGALRALVATPLVMPAVVIAAALVSLKKVYDLVVAIRDTLRSIENTNKSLDSIESALGRAREQYKSGAISKQRYNAILQGAYSGLPGRARGGEVQAGMPYKVGEQGEELFVPKQSGTIVPNNKLGSGGGTVNINVNVGMYAGTEMEKRKMARELMSAFQDVAKSNNLNWGH